MRRLISAALVAVLMAPAAQAQQHQHGQPQGQGQKPQMGQHQMGGMQGGMQMGGGLPGPLRSLAPYAPDHILKMKEMLELSADQEKQLTTLAEWAKQAGEQAHAPAEAAMQGLRTEMGKPAPDQDAMRSYVVAHATAMGNMQWVRAEAALKAKALLTESQRKHVEEMK
ncbi:MAG TPA: hypothetical protein VF862_00910 [Gemmatimonadales bacterium]